MTIGDLITLLQGIPVDLPVFVLDTSAKSTQFLEREPKLLVLPRDSHLYRAFTIDRSERVVVQF